ncbi:M48 family metalloprotease [Rhizobium sp. PAMB 3174]
MTDIVESVPRHPVGATAFVLILGAAAGTVIALVFAFVISSMGVAAGGPLAILFFAPLLLGVFSMTALYILIGVPVWALIGGMLFAARFSTGAASPAAQVTGVTFLSEGHPIHEATQRMAARLGLPPVAHIGWYDSDTINAFAMGTKPGNALIAVSKGAVEKLSRDELDAVLGHELGHVACNDMARMTYALGVREALTFFLVFARLKAFARWLFMPFSELELLRFSRTREFTADAIAARLTSPEAMISVLETLRHAKGESPNDDLAMVKMFALGDRTWLSTHPPLEDRIAALKALPLPVSRVAAVTTDLRSADYAISG